jgi:RNA polymerase sigma-70 factor (ECF subfamily)
MTDQKCRETDHLDHGRWISSTVQEYEGALVRYAAQITGDLDRGRDVVQDTFLRLCKQNPQQLDGRLAQWLYTVCRHRALDIRRKEDRMKTMTQDQSAAQSYSGSTIDQVERQETVDHVSQFIDGLSENQREVVRLKFQNGLSYKEIAAITELSVSNVGYLIHTAIKSLRKDLQVDCG